MKKTVQSALVVIAIGVMAWFITQPVSHAADELFSVPLGLPPVPVPVDNPMTEEKVELGKMLFFDKRLSVDRTVSCATCHLPEYAYAEPKALSTGVNGQKGDKNAPKVLNSAYLTSIFWDGRVKTLEEQSIFPIENPVEMGHSIEAAANDLNKIAEYKKRFEAVFGEPANSDTISKAIAAFERTLLSGNSPYDRYMNGDASALNDQAKAGLQLFNGKALCSSCHTPPFFTNGNFVNAGIGAGSDDGRMNVTKSPIDKGAFRVPPLREVAETAPYFHDGSVATLEEAVKIMTNGGIENPNLYLIFRAVPKMTDEENAQLVEFLKSLSGEYPVVEEPELP